jgi:hypothetical protein
MNRHSELRRTAMPQRKTPLARSSLRSFTLLGSRSPGLRQTGITPVSGKRVKQQREYMKLRREFLESRPACEVPGCRKPATEVHHMAGRIGDAYLDVDRWLPICHDDHVYVTAHPAWAIEAGLSLPRVGGAA